MHKTLPDRVSTRRRPTYRVSQHAVIVLFSIRVGSSVGRCVGCTWSAMVVCAPVAMVASRQSVDHLTTGDDHHLLITICMLFCIVSVIVVILTTASGVWPYSLLAHRHCDFLRAVAGNSCADLRDCDSLSTVAIATATKP